MRAFLAVEPPPALREAVARDAAALPVHRRDFRLVRPEQLHLTLRFFAAIDDARGSALTSAAALACALTGPFSVAAGRFGAFSHRGRARVLWLGVDDAHGKLAALSAALDDALAAAGFPRDEDRAFRPHLTVARARGRGGARVDERALAGAAAPAGEVWPVDELVLFSSVTSSAGAVHSPVARIPLSVSG